MGKDGLYPKEFNSAMKDIKREQKRKIAKIKSQLPLIVINNIKYNCPTFQYINTDGVEHLQVSILGELKDNNNKLHIDYNEVSYFGCKILPSCNFGVTNFLVYIYQEVVLLVCFFGFIIWEVVNG